MGNARGVGYDGLTRLAGARHARTASVGLLAAAAVGQAVTQAVANGGHPVGSPAALAVDGILPLALLALLATTPLALLRPAMSAVAVMAGNAVALAWFGQVTVGGVIAMLAAACWLGYAGGLDGPVASRVFERLGARGDPTGANGPGKSGWSGGMAGRYLAVGVGLPFLVIALTGSTWVAVLLAAAVPVASGIGIAAWSGRLARTGTEAGEALADTLLAHTARGERARIARELHDVVAHHISMIAVLSETGRLTTPGLPEAGARRFAEIGDTARAGLTEMRRLLGVLREDAFDDADGAAGSASPTTPLARDAAGTPLAPGLPQAARPSNASTSNASTSRASRQPQPGLAQLAQLIDAAREASMAGTRLIISGPVAPLDPGVELAAYRIVQEALTNARRHAPGAAVDVELRYGPETLRLRVRDNGLGPVTSPAMSGPDSPVATEAQPAVSGHGLLGMRERAFSVGGSLYTGMAPGGGFLVEAVLPSAQDLINVTSASARSDEGVTKS